MRVVLYGIVYVGIDHAQKKIGRFGGRAVVLWIERLWSIHYMVSLALFMYLGQIYSYS